MEYPRTLKLTVNGHKSLKQLLDAAGYNGAVNLRVFVPINNSATTVYVTLSDKTTAPANTDNGIPIDSTVGKQFAFEAGLSSIEFDATRTWLYAASAVDILAVIAR